MTEYGIIFLVKGEYVIFAITYQTREQATEACYQLNVHTYKNSGMPETLHTWAVVPLPMTEEEQDAL